MQEGPNWFWQDYPLNQQIWYFNTIQEADFMFVHNESDKKYYEGLTSKECKILPSLMIEDSIKDLPQVERNNIIIGGNFCSWYGGFDSYITAQEFGTGIFVPSMGRKIEGEEGIPGLNHLPYMNWINWMNNLSRFKYAVHLMPTFAAGTFALNCAYHGIPCIGYEGLDTQSHCHPQLTVKMNDLNGASLEIRESVRSLLTIIYRSLDFESYGPSREIIARNLDIIRNGSLSCRRLVESLLSEIRDDLIFAENIVGLENMVDIENIMQADIDQLLDIPLYRISGYGIDRSEEEIRKIEAQLRSVKYKLNSLSSCAIEFLEQLIRTYREKYPRRSKVKLFAPIEKRVAAPKDLIFRYDKESGYLGYNIDSGVELFNISLFDRVAIVRSGGIVGIHDTLDKMYVDLDILYCAPEQKELVFTIAYQDLEGFFYIKRFSLDRCRINQLYELVPGNSSLIAFTVEVDPVIILSCENTQQGEEIKQYLESSAFSIRSHRARGDRIETAQYSNIKFAKR